MRTRIDPGLATLLIALAPLTQVEAWAGDGVCTPREEAAQLCFVSSQGFVVEAVTGPRGEFPVIDDQGDSVFSYQISGPGFTGGSCAQVFDVSHADIALPGCPDRPLEIIDWTGTGERFTGGQGEPSCGFGAGDPDNDLWKWDYGVGCGATATYTIVIAGQVPAAPTDFFLKAGLLCESGTILGPDCENPFRYCVGAPNSTGEGGSIDWEGSISISDNDFRLSGAQLPPEQPGFFFFGSEQKFVPFGNGFRCIGGDVQRLQKIAIEVTGTTFLEFDFTVPPFDQILPGIPYYFQLYYRDPAGRGEGFNTTDALCIVFAP